ncbi:hypothetical protein [Curtobacterium sp. VKM Ac-1395]|jgi:hypothetical protein|uniref:hypothetical protein n=1 Tax=Curtobacterium sp. VKM Ac-1395 TaxID=2783815 RepID=UPI00188B0B03|nr:hypothetical protein [Curtobacterium sp. VKM Ac-1395]MBF4591096.1 hypothetical protein [Curtobacterium sp. VKM Ac-1395]
MTTNASSATTRSERSALTSGLAVLGMGLIVATLTGCSLLEPYQKEQQQHYDTYSDAPSKADSEDLAWFMPAWVPEDATDIDVRLDTEEPGYVIAFDSASGVDTAACTPLDGPHGGPAMSAGFLPDSLPTTGLLTCGDGRATAEVDGRWYGWTTKEPVAADTNDTLRTD